MKNNKKIITEVSRLQELMGVKKELINEQPKNMVLGVKTLKRLVSQSSKTASVKTALLKRINKLTDISQTAAQKVTAIKYILKYGDEQMVKAINKLIKDQSENTIKLLNKTIDDNRPMIQGWIEDGLTKKEIIKIIVNDSPIIKTGDDAIDLLMKSELIQKVGKAFDEIKGVPTPKKTPVKKKTSGEQGGTPPKKVPDGDGEVETIANIEKTFNEVVEDISEAEITLLNKKYSKTISKWIEKLKAIYGPYFQRSLKLQDDILKDIAMYNKIKPNLRPAFAKRIIAKQQTLGMFSKEFLDSTNIWIEKNIRPMATRSNPEMLDFYQKLKKAEGWKRINILGQLLTGIKTGIKDLFEGNKELRGAWLKVMGKPLSIPINIISKTINKIMSKDLKMLNQLSETERKAFWNWFKTTNPKGLPALKDAFKGGVIQGLSYVSIQALYRYFILSMGIGISRSLGAWVIDGVDQYTGTNLSDKRILNYFMGIDNYDKSWSDLKDIEGSGDVMDYIYAGKELLMSQSEPFRSFLGIWPAYQVGRAMVDLGKSVVDGTLEEDVEAMIDEQQQIIQDNPELIPVIEDEATPDESTTPGEPGSFEHFNKQVNGKGTDNGDGTFTAYGSTVKWDGKKYESIK